MASFKCPDCGATLTDDSRFCKYCGAKIDDGVKRMEINVNKKIEDIAEIKRAEREEKEFLRRERKEKAANIAKWTRRGILAAIFGVGIFFVARKGENQIAGVVILLFASVYVILS